MSLVTKGKLLKVKFKLKTALSGVAAAAIVGGGFLALAPASFAAGPTAPSWEPDANSAPPYGNIAFYDANGVAVTSGTNLSSPFAYAVGTTPADTGATKAAVNFYNPGSNSSSNPSLWTGTPETGSNTFSPASGLPSGTPANIVALAPTYPINAASAASISSWITLNTPSGGQYNNIIQVRLTDTGSGGHGNAAGTYWSTDIAYNTTSSAITVDGTTVPANGWAQLFPLVANPPTVTTLSTNATGGHALNGASITLSATTAASSTLPGYVVFEDNGAVIDNVPAVVGGPTTYTYTPANNSTNSYTASFVPEPPAGDETGANTATATQTTSSTSSAQTVVTSPPQTATTTTLSASSSSISYGGSETLTSTVSAADSTNPAGTVEFLDGATPITGCTSVAVNPPTSATCTTAALPQGTDSITAVFTPTSNTYATSTSPAVVVTVAAPAACSLTGSSCSDTQNITVTVNPGTITITTPYTAADPFVLPAMTLSSDGTYLESSAAFPASTNPYPQQIVVTSTLAPAYAWTLSVAATNLSNGSGGTIASSGLGLTNGALLNGGSAAGDYSGTVSFTNIAAHNPSPQDTDTNTGLTSTPQTWATTTAADGTADMDGMLTLLAPTSTPPGTYTGTITFSVS